MATNIRKLLLNTINNGSNVQTRAAALQTLLQLSSPHENYQLAATLLCQKTDELIFKTLLFGIKNQFIILDSNLKQLLSNYIITTQLSNEVMIQVNKIIPQLKKQNKTQV